MIYIHSDVHLRRHQVILDPTKHLHPTQLCNNLPLDQRQRQRPKGPRVSRLGQIIPNQPAMSLRHLSPTHQSLPSPKPNSSTYLYHHPVSRPRTIPRHEIPRHPYHPLYSPHFGKHRMLEVHHIPHFYPFPSTVEFGDVDCVAGGSEGGQH